MTDLPATSVWAGGDVPKGNIHAYLETNHPVYFAAADDLRALSPDGLVLAFIGGFLAYEYDPTDTTSADSGGSVPAVLKTANGRRYKRVVLVGGDTSGVTTIKKITQSAYDALSPPDPNTLYVIIG